MATFPPAPWIVDGPGSEHVVTDSYHVVEAKPGYPASDGGLYLAAIMSLDTAHLISAAPDTLPALKDLVLAYEALRRRTGYEASDPSVTLDAARAAIAKAEGRS
jgi:hypothetical protein